MRTCSIVLAAMLLASPLAAQRDSVVPGDVSSMQPLPAELVPPVAERPVAESPGEKRLALGLITGFVVGAAVGGVARSVTYDDDCAWWEDECLLSARMETMLFWLVGGSLGAIVGGGTSYLLDRRDASPPAAPVSVAPMRGGGMRVGVTLRH